MYTQKESMGTWTSRNDNKCQAELSFNTLRLGHWPLTGNFLKKNQNIKMK
jgi:hypothetical protein